MMLSHTGRLAPQSMLGERYMIVGLAGRGGMGCVYKATDTHADNRLVAIKEMSQASLSSEKLSEAQERFRLEAEILGKLAHPNLPRVLDSFTESGRSYLVMDFIDGKTLLQLLTESPDHQLPVELVLRYAIQLCNVLDYLHTQSPPVIFRDLKPSNVMVTAQGEVYLIDFGIARHFTQGKLQDTIPLGSEGFCPPEQFGTGQTSPRSDLYSLGATLHYALTGKNPRSNKPTLFDFAPLTDLNQQVPGDLNKLTLWLVATREEQRPQSAAQVRQLLQAIEQWTTNSTTATRRSKTLPFVRMNSEHFYDTKTARAALSRQWLMRFNVLPGPAGTWCALVLIPFLALIYGQIEAWLFLFVLPVLQRFREVGGNFFRRLGQKNDGQAFGLARVMTSPIWTPYFVLLFLMVPLLLGGWCFYLLNEAKYAPPFVILSLCSFLLLLTGGVFVWAHIRSTRTKTMMIATMLALSLLALALLSLPAVQSALSLLTPNQLLCCILPGLAFLSLLRPSTRFVWADHLSMACTIAVYALLQYGFGLQELGVSGTLALVINNTLVGILGGMTLTAALRMRRPFTWGARVLLCVVSCIGIGLQYTFGLQEIGHAPVIATLLQAVPLDPLDLVSLNILLAVGPTLLTLAWLFFRPVQCSARLARLPLVVLALTAAGLQSFLGDSLRLPPFFVHASPLAFPIASLLNLAQVLACTLVILIIVLCTRLIRRFSWLDHGAIFAVSLICALLQSTAWDRATHLSTPHREPATMLSSSLVTMNQSQIYTAAYNKLLAQGLMFVVVCAFGLVGLLSLAYLLGRLAPLRHFFGCQRRFWTSARRFLLRLEHGLLLVVTLTCLLLYWFFGKSTILLRFSLGFFTVGQLVLFLLIVAALLALVRITRTFGRVERLIVQIDALACALLLLRSPADGSALQAVQYWQIDLALPSPFVACGLILTALISLFWLKSPAPSWTRRMLLALFGCALLCTLLQSVSYTLVMIALLLLMEGILLAVQLGEGEIDPQS